MSRRRQDGGEGSLELLLDTICNTFGGVLFLAMLVSLLLSQSRRRSDAEDAAADPQAALTPAELARLDMKAQDLAAELTRLESGLRQAREAAADFAVPGMEAELALLERAEESRDRLEAARRRGLADLAAVQAAAARAKAAAAGKERDARQAAERAAAARSRLEAAVEERERLVQEAIRLRDVRAARATVQTTGRAPRERATSKQEFGVMLRYGRLYLMKVLRDGEMVVNEDDFFVTAGTDRNVARPKPHAGLDLGSQAAMAGPLDERLRPFPAGGWYPCLVVHPDSFDAFVDLKAELVARGYEYRLIPTAASVVDRGGRGAVQ